MSHTPGPWTIERLKDVRGIGEDSWEITRAETSEVIGYLDFTPDANARLIAAAPELLAALTDLLDQIRVACHHTGLNGMPAHNAIRKAEGLNNGE